jgi:ABC-type dipeptide/oligopeptide/nickel transport system permease component
MALRDRWEWFDVGALALCVLMLLWSIVDRRMSWSRNLAASFLFLAIVFVLVNLVVDISYAIINPRIRYS